MHFEGLKGIVTSRCCQRQRPNCRVSVTPQRRAVTTYGKGDLRLRAHSSAGSSYSTIIASTVIRYFVKGFRKITLLSWSRRSYTELLQVLGCTKRSFKRLKSSTMESS